MEENINVLINGNEYTIKKGSSLKEISRLVQKDYRYPILVAKVNNSLKELTYEITKNKEIEFQDLTMSFGSRAHTSGLVFVLIVAIKELLG